MQQCQIHDAALKFSRAVYGILVLIAVLIQSEWLVLAAAILVILGAVSFKLNIAYQFYILVLKKILNDKSPLVLKESGELSFVAGMTGVLLLVGYIWLYYAKVDDFAWVYILIVDLLIFLACFVGFCVATLMYVLLKKLFKK
jgi:hypothetical protein